MSTYQDYQKQIAELQEKAEAARRIEVEEAKNKIRELMETFGIAMSDLTGGAKKVAKVPRKPVEIKYKNQATGETWTGRGRAPKWLDGKDKSQFAI